MRHLLGPSYNQQTLLHALGSTRAAVSVTLAARACKVCDLRTRVGKLQAEAESFQSRVNAYSELAPKTDGRVSVTKLAHKQRQLDRMRDIKQHVDALIGGQGMCEPDEFKARWYSTQAG
jgi:hypothetical protein